jgi:membrane-bound lytic murein transglycosylase F
MTNKEDMLMFILASYNVGPGHVEDAARLAGKYGKDPDLWEDHVEYYLLLKSDPRYHEDPLCTSGYCRGEEPVEYVQHVLKQYTIYKQLIRG